MNTQKEPRRALWRESRRKSGKRVREKDKREGDIGEHGAGRNQSERNERGCPMSKDKRVFKTVTPSSTSASCQEFLTGLLHMKLNSSLFSKLWKSNMETIISLCKFIRQVLSTHCPPVLKLTRAA